MTFQEFSNLITNNFPEFKDYIYSQKRFGDLHYYIGLEKYGLAFAEFFVSVDSINFYNCRIVKSATQLPLNYDNAGVHIIMNELNKDETISEFLVRIIETYKANILECINYFNSYNFDEAYHQLKELGFKAVTKDYALWEFVISKDVFVSIDLPFYFNYSTNASISKSFKQPVAQKCKDLKEAIEFLTE